MRVDNRIGQGGVSYVRLEKREVIVELYDGERIIFQAVKTENLNKFKEVEKIESFT